jgi:UDP-glucose 4-epimerase
MARLITGGSGLVGSELAHSLVAKNESVVVFDVMKSNRLVDIEGKIKFVRGDLGNWPEVFNVIKENSVTHIYHLGAMLTFESELNPWGSFQSNVVGTYNVFEAARLLGVKQMMFTSSIGTYGLETGETISDTTIQRPVGIYGIGKLYCEGLGRYYRQNLGVDFRCIRYAAVVGPGVHTPGHWVPPMIEAAAAGKPYESMVTENTGTWMISLKDAARAADMVLEAPKEAIKMVNYNVSGCIRTVTAKEVAEAIKKYLPGARITFQKEQNLPSVHKGHTGKYFDDSYARKEWGWQAEHDDVDKIVGAFLEGLRNKT